MGIKNYLIDGVSCAGKTTVCDELQRRGYHAIHGDRELAYWGDPNTGEPVTGCAGAQRTWMWNVEKVRALVPITPMRQRSFAVVPGIPTVSSICSMEFSFLRSIWIR